MIQVNAPLALNRAFSTFAPVVTGLKGRSGPSAFNGIYGKTPFYHGAITQKKTEVCTLAIPQIHALTNYGALYCKVRTLRLEFAPDLLCLPVPVEEKKKLPLMFTYSVVWEERPELAWASRWDTYLSMSDDRSTGSNWYILLSLSFTHTHHNNLSHN